MADKSVITLAMPQEKLEDLAHRRGYDSPENYIQALITADVLATHEEYDFDTKEGILAGLRESWHQAMTGDTRPVSELWDALNQALSEDE